MTAQLALATLAAFLGFAASVFFMLGAIRLDAGLIHQLASPRWDFHAEIARYLIGQKTEYTCGAVLLLIAFVAQAISIAPFPFNQAVVFAAPEFGFVVIALAGVALWIASAIICRLSSRATMKLVAQLAKEAQEREERQLREEKGAL